MVAADKNNTEMVRLLLDKGATALEADEVIQAYVT